LQRKIVYMISLSPANKYKSEKDFEFRKKQANKHREQRPDLVPLIVQKTNRSSLLQLQNNKFLIERSLTLKEL